MRRPVTMLVALLMVAGVVYATESRIRAMGETNRFFRDNIEVYGNPAYLGDYTKLAFGEFGAYDGRKGWAGLNLKLVENVNIGIAVQRVEGRIYDIDEVAGESISGFRPINGLDIMGNIKMGSLSFGLGIYSAGNKTYSKVVRANGTVFTEDTKKTGVLGLKLGGVISPSENSLFEGALRIGLNSYKHENLTNDTTETYELSGGMDLGVGLRGFLPYSDNVTIVPVLSFSTFSYKQKYTNDKVSQANFELGSISDMSLVFGVGLNYKFNKTLIVPGFSIEYMKATDESDTTQKLTSSMAHIPIVNLGVETELSSHFTGRFGVKKGFGYHSSKREPSSGGSSEISFRGGENTDLITTGLSLKFGKLVIESAISTDALFNGGYIFSGVPAYLNSQLSITYSF